LRNYCFVKGLEEHHAGWVLSLLTNNSSEWWHILLNRLSKLLALCFQLIIRGKVFDIFLSVILENSIFVGLFIVHFH